MIYFRTDVEVPVNGQIDVNVPPPFTPSCPGSLYDARVTMLGGDVVASASPCTVTSPTGSATNLPHVLSFGPLTSSLQSNTAYLLTFRATYLL